MISEHYAAMLPLDFTAERTEYSVIFVSTKWSEILQLLDDTSGFLLRMGQLWPQAEHKDAQGNVLPPFEWILLNPVTIFLQWIGASQSGFQRTAALLDPHLTAESRSKLHNATQGVSLGTQAATDFLLDFKDTGLFVAEFSLNTHTLTVRYQPPVTGEKPIFTGEYTNGSFVQFTDADVNRRAAATLHFDIGKDTTQRAEFIVDYLVDCAGACARATAQNELTKGTATLVPQGQMLPLGKMDPIVPPQYLLDPEVQYPSVIVETTPSVPEGQSTVRDENYPPDCLVCIEVNGVWTNPASPGDPSAPATFLIGPTIVKCYAPPTPPPAPPQ